MNTNKGLHIFFYLQMAMTGAAAICVDKFGRKPLLIFSGLGSCISILALGVFCYLDENKKCVSNAESQSPLIINQSKIFNKLMYELSKVCIPNTVRLSQESLLITT